MHIGGFSVPLDNITEAKDKVRHCEKILKKELYFFAFGSQSTHVLPVQGKKNVFIYMGDRWTPENLADSRHIWLPVEWEKGNPVIKWYPGWDLSKLK